MGGKRCISTNYLPNVSSNGVSRATLTQIILHTPDFIVRGKNGKCMIVEIKREHDREHPVDGENGRKAMATRKWVGLNPERLKYEIVFAKEDVIGYDQTKRIRDFVERKEIV